MNIKTDNSSYNILSKLIHWIMALLILGTIFLGVYMDIVPSGDYKYWLYAQHKSFGVLVIILVFIRILWNSLSNKVGSISTHKKWEKILSKITHISLYILMFALPLSGWAMSSFGGYPVKLFGLELPSLVSKNKEISEIFGEIHQALAQILIFIIGLHMLGAFKHHFIDKDETLKRMVSRSVGIIGGVIILLLAIIAYIPAIYYISEDIIEDIIDIDDDDYEKEEHDYDDHDH